MKTNILAFVLFLLVVLGATPGQAQVTFTSTVAGGKWSDPATWTVRGGTSGQAVPTNPATARTRAAANEIIVINSPVVLDQDYAVTGADGMLTITATGSLVEDVPGRTLSFGSQSGPDKLRLVTDGPLQVSTLSFYKADADINAPLEAACSIVLANQSTLDVSSSVSIEGNLILMQGNNSVVNESGSLDGTGQLLIDGCVMTRGNGRGLVRDLFSAGLQVCIKGESSDCGLAALDNTANMDCNSYALEAITVNACASPLPVQLVSFAARPQGSRVQLTWTTASELNSASFTVERSADGSSFSPVTTVKAAGTSTAVRNYTAVDATPRTGLNYYRLRQQDLDGTTAFSQVVTVETGAAATAQQMSVYGSPRLLNVDMQLEGVCQTIRVLDNMGRVVQTVQLPAGQTGTFSRQVPLAQGASGGIYIVQALTSQGTVSRRVLLREE